MYSPAGGDWSRNSFALLPAERESWWWGLDALGTPFVCTWREHDAVGGEGYARRVSWWKDGRHHSKSDGTTR